MEFLFILSLFFSSVLSIEILFDGRAKPDYNAGTIDGFDGPYRAVVGYTELASYYIQFIRGALLPTPLWSGSFTEDVIAISVDNTSILDYEANPNFIQLGVRRTELIPQNSSTVTQVIEATCVNTTVFHFSIAADQSKPLNFTHEYHVAYIEPGNGVNTFEVQLGSPFTNPTGNLPADGAQNFKVLDHDSNLLFTTPFTYQTWHNFAVAIDWDNLTLAIFYSTGDQPLKLVSPTKKNQGALAGSEGQGAFSFGILKLPLVNPSDSPEQRGDWVHHGIQEGTTEGLFYSGVFIEKITGASGPALSGPI